MIKITSLLLISLLLIGCEYGRMYDQPNPRPTKIVQQTVPANIVQSSKDHPEREMKMNPYHPTEENIKFGAKTYRAFCHHCHGADWKGHTHVGDGFPVQPTDLNLPQIQTKPDSDFYAHIFYGGNFSPALGTNMSDEEIWKVIMLIKTGRSKTIDSI